MSPPEIKLWHQLRQRPGGLKFRKQHPLDPYVADFYCCQAKLVIEVDGWVHESGEVALRDECRDAWLQERGLRIMRIAAAEIMRDVILVAAGIVARAGSPLHQAPPGPPPRSGED